MKVERYPLRDNWARILRESVPGLATALTVAAAANFVSLAYGGPVMLLALLIGMALNFLAANPAASPGLSVASRPVLQVGVALLGLRISFGDIISLGSGTVLVVIAGVLTAIVAGLIVARLAGRSFSFGALAGGATGICGASAALAIAAVLPRSEPQQRETAFVIVAVTTLSTIAMVLYPVLAHWLGFDDRKTGLLLGATIHDVAQVVGAGYAVSPEAGDAATIVKLFRVALLLPTVFLIAIAFTGSKRGFPGTVSPLPGFAVAFAILVAANSLGLVPPALAAPLGELSRWCLITAVASIGIRTSIPQMLGVGRASLAVPIGATVAMLVVVVLLLTFIRV